LDIKRELEDLVLLTLSGSSTPSLTVSAPQLSGKTARHFEQAYNYARLKGAWLRENVLFNQQIAQVLEDLEGAVVREEESDLRKQDKATKAIVFQRKVQALIQDEYTAQAVQNQKSEDEKQVCRLFNVEEGHFEAVYETGKPKEEKPICNQDSSLNCSDSFQAIITIVKGSE